MTYSYTLTVPEGHFKIMTSLNKNVMNSNSSEKAECYNNYQNILLRVQPLLCNDRERSKYTRAVTHTHARTEVLLETALYIRSVQKVISRTTEARTAQL
jgi:hypothetical protein